MLASFSVILGRVLFLIVILGHVLFFIVILGRVGSFFSFVIFGRVGNADLTRESPRVTPRTALSASVRQEISKPALLFSSAYAPLLFSSLKCKIFDV
ncbi:MAG TPA: hypothetical protein DIC64_03050 [Alphaproteobacteria bacterium]|nr:hypothetical protein [Alphaproteobacteria bacterium]